jgi:hypothetical protein
LIGKKPGRRNRLGGLYERQGRRTRSGRLGHYGGIEVELYLTIEKDLFQLIISS